jgi:outer membrane protein assembly factor BamD
MRAYFLLIAFTVALLSGCGANLDPTKDWGPDRFYQEAKVKLTDGDYEGAIKLFEQLEARYPYGQYAEQSQLEVAYAYYKYDEPALALAAAERFIRLHPTHPSVDYAYYLKGIVNFSGERSLINWLFGAKEDPMEHDPKALRDAYEAFRELVERFPRSRYAGDARARMAYLFDAQARYEVHVARFYFERGAYHAAVNRSRQTLESYPRTPATEDALGVQAMSYKMLGLTRLMDDTLRVLKLNFPQSRYFAEVEALKAPVRTNGSG